MTKSNSFSEDLIALMPNLRRFAISLCRSRDIADDLVQVTVEKAFAAQASFDPDTRMDAWLFRILRNAWIDMTRRQKTQGTQIDIDDMPDAKAVDGVQVAEISMMLKSAQMAIEELPEEQREVMLLICAEEMSYKEAAELLAIPIGTVMSRLARARIAVAGKLGINPTAGRSSDRQGDK